MAKTYKFRTISHFAWTWSILGKIKPHHFIQKGLFYTNIMEYVLILEINVFGQEFIEKMCCMVPY